MVDYKISVNIISIYTCVHSGYVNVVNCDSCMIINYNILPKQVNFTGGILYMHAYLHDRVSDMCTCR